MLQAFRIEVFKRSQQDGRAIDLLGQIAHLGLKQVDRVRISPLFFLRGALSPPARQNEIAENTQIRCELIGSLKE